MTVYSSVYNVSSLRRLSGWLNLMIKMFIDGSTKDVLLGITNLNSKTSSHLKNLNFYHFQNSSFLLLKNLNFSILYNLLILFQKSLRSHFYVRVIYYLHKDYPFGGSLIVLKKELTLKNLCN
jgi:hypothetical protein